MERRTFLKLAGIGAGAAVVTAGIGAVTYQPAVDFYRSAGGSAGGAGRRALVAYASRTGSTGEVAAEVGRVLAQSGFQTDVLPIREAPGPSGYDVAAIGSAVRMSSWLPEALDYVEANAAGLERVGAAVFSVCMTMQADTPENRERADVFLQPVRARMRTLREASFGGKVDPARLSLVERLALRAKGVPEGDYRDWDALRAFATRLAAVTESAGIAASAQ